ncbi:hypothetical protein I4U23_007466 [Adineta vaga]|nr:hypothetical protein I4U23_007466 [Adineta vaga]
MGNNIKGRLHGHKKTDQSSSSHDHTTATTTTATTTTSNPGRNEVAHDINPAPNRARATEPNISDTGRGAPAPSRDSEPPAPTTVQRGRP